MTNNDVMITHAKRKGKLVSIKDVPKGEKINCICTKCGKPLGAKKGDYKDHHFYHIVKADCNGETYFHIEAKLQIVKDSSLMLPYPYEEEKHMTKAKWITFKKWEKLSDWKEVRTVGEDGWTKTKNIPPKFKKHEHKELQEAREEARPKEPRYTKVEFEKVEVEKRIGNSKYIADVICTHKNGTELIVEIAYTHYTTKQKERYLIDNKIPSIEIDLHYLKSFNMNWKPEKESLSKYMTGEHFTNKTRWIYNSKETPR